MKLVNKRNVALLHDSCTAWECAWELVGVAVLLFFCVGQCKHNHTL